MTAAAGRALESMGYLVAQQQGLRSEGLWATQGDVAIGLLVHDGGAIEADIAGCVADACRPLMSELVVALAREGVAVAPVQAVHHGDRRGGQLIARAAAAARGESMAVGLVRQHETGIPSATANSHPMPGFSPW